MEAKNNSNYLAFELTLANKTIGNKLLIPNRVFDLLKRFTLILLIVFLPVINTRRRAFDEPWLTTKCKDSTQMSFRHCISDLSCKCHDIRRTQPCKMDLNAICHQVVDSYQQNGFLPNSEVVCKQSDSEVACRMDVLRLEERSS